jgi:hypothetical protein
MDHIKRALECAGLLTVGEFIEESKYPVDGFLLKFFSNLTDDIPIYITNELIEWCGFEAKEFGNRKLEFNRMLKNFKEEDYWVYTNKEYREKYTNNPNYPNPAEFAGKNKTKHLILTVDCFKLILMSLHTPKSNLIKIHFVSMEKLVLTYMKYQCAFLKKSYEKEIDDLKGLLHVKNYSRMQRVAELEAEIEGKYRVGVVYYICEEDNPNIVKIGYTFDLVGRLAALQTAHYKELIVKKYHFAQFPREEEKRLHNKYKNSLIRGEWYRL